MLEVFHLVWHHDHAVVIGYRYKEVLTHCVKQFAQNILKCKDWLLPRDQAFYFLVSRPAVHFWSHSRGSSRNVSTNCTDAVRSMWLLEDGILESDTSNSVIDTILLFIIYFFRFCVYTTGFSSSDLKVQGIWKYIFGCKYIVIHFSFNHVMETWFLNMCCLFNSFSSIQIHCSS
jgi:hypothetical protein